jgi:ABC-type bacteriocin/lantibiotic exporter with double-glycine peptidase domain
VCFNVYRSRTFMRLMNPRTRLVVVDEPSSAMDPLGEYELFERLRAMRAGRTMVFVTHRFGHLTKYADVILCVCLFPCTARRYFVHKPDRGVARCMKNGELVEIGTHRELMTKGGEYCALYGVQARAFTEPGAPGAVPVEIDSEAECINQKIGEDGDTTP